MPQAIFAALAACWPAAETRRLGPWTLRRGEGGRRTCAATLDGPPEDPRGAEAAIRAMGQRPLFMIRPGDEALDALLADRGYDRSESVAILGAAAADLAGAQPDWAVIRCDAPLAVMVEIWTAGSVGPGRLAVMRQAPLPRSWLLARKGDQPAGCAFVDLDGETAMLHAIIVTPGSRRRGLGGRLIRTAAAWTLDQGGTRLALAVSCQNAPAIALYRSLGLAEIARYHYRAAPA